MDIKVNGTLIEGMTETKDDEKEKRLEAYAEGFEKENSEKNDAKMQK